MFTFDITPDGGELVRIVATSRDIAMWERTTKGASLARIERDARMTDLEEIAFRAAVRHGAWTGGDLATFRAQVDIAPINVAQEAADKAKAEAAARGEDGDVDDQDDDGAGPTPPAP